MIQQRKLVFVMCFIISSISNVFTANYPNARHGRQRKLSLKNVCEEGSYYSVVKTECIACLCDQIGSQNVTCDANTGQCFCKMGYNGQKCASCGVGYYRDIFKKTCLPCNCSKDGSKSIACNLLGQCQCKRDIGGKKCNRCLNLNLNFRKECTESCPGMYGVVAKEFGRFDQKLDEVQNVLNGIGVEKNRMDEFASKIADLSQEIANKLKKDAQNDVFELSEVVNELQDEIRSYTEHAEDLNELQAITEQVLGELAKIYGSIMSSRGICVDTCKKAVSHSEERSQFLQKLTEIRENYKIAFSKGKVIEKQVNSLKNQAQISVERNSETLVEVKDFIVPKHTNDGAVLSFETHRINEIFRELTEIKNDLRKVQELYEHTTKRQVDYALLTVGVIHEYLDNCTLDVGNRTSTILTDLQSYENRLRNNTSPLLQFQSNITVISRLIDHNFDRLKEFEILAETLIKDDNKTRLVLMEIFDLINKINVTIFDGINVLVETNKDLAREEADFDKKWTETEQKTNEAIKKMEEKNEALERDLVEIEADLSKTKKDVEALEEILEKLNTIVALSKEVAQLKSIKEELDRLDNDTLCTITLV
ncbi:hypothetical protein Trydic_g2714 [Trypoxylus dichotomus]